MKSLLSWASAAVVCVGLSACGGGGGGGGSASSVSAEPVAQPPVAQQVQGRVVRLAALAGAAVTLRDASGAQAQALTDAEGRFSLSLPTVRWPALLRVEPAGTTAADRQTNVLWAALTAAPAQAASVTPLTSAVVAGLTRGEPELAFQTLSSSAASRDAFALARLIKIENAARNAAIAAAGSTGAVVRDWLGVTPRLTDLPFRVEVAEVANVLARFSVAAEYAALVGQVVGHSQALAIGCDVAGFATLANGATRAACQLGSYTPLHQVALGSVRALPKTEHTGSAESWADLLSGWYRMRHWKTYDAQAQSQARLQAFAEKVKAHLATQLPASDITLLNSEERSSARVDAAVAALQRVDWRASAAALDFQDVSPITHSWFALRDLLASERGRSQLFGLGLPSAVRLMSPPHHHYSARPLGRLAARTHTLATDWLLNAGNRSGGAADFSYNEVIDAGAALFEIMVTSSAGLDCMGEPCRTVVQRRTSRLTAAVAAVPAAPAALSSAAQTLNTSLIDLTRICGEASQLPILTSQRTQADAACNAAVSSFGSAAAVYNGALFEAVSASAAANADTPAAYFARFVAALRAGLQQEIEQRFATHWPLQELLNTMRFQPLVVYGEVRRGSISAEVLDCCLTRPEVEAPIDAVFYRLDGSRLEFSALPSGRTNPHSFAPTPIVLLEAELLSLTQGAALPHTPPEEWVLGVVGQSVHAAALACSRADTACKTALHRSRVLNKTSTEGVLLQKSVAFSDVLQLIQNNGGIPFWTLDPSFSSL